VSLFQAAGLALAALRAHKLRSFLNLLGIVIAVTTIIAVVSVVSGLNDHAARVINTLGPNTFVLTKFGLITSRDAFLQAAKRKDITRQDLEAVRRGVPAAAHVSGRVFAVRPVWGEGQRLRDVFVVGAESEFVSMVGIEMEDGRWFTRAETDASRPVAVLGWDVKTGLFPRVDPIGRTIKIQGKPFRVIGTIRQQGRAFGQSQDNFVGIPLGAFGKAFGRDRSIDIFIDAPDGEARQAIEDRARMVLRARRGTPFREPDPFDELDASALQALWRNLTVLAFALVTVIASITLVVGGVAIANTLFASIVERTREIGIRKAVGARRRDIRRQFLFEAVMLAGVGGLIGVAVGGGAAALVTALSPFPVRVHPGLVGMALGVALLTGALAGWVPAVRVSRLDAVVAIREE
jgi:putative ABC transport system permease protein